MKISAQTILKNTTISLGIIGISLVATYTLLQRVYAQEAQRTITIVPPSEELSLKPGGKAEGVLKVINDSNQPITFTAATQDFIVNDTKGTPDFLAKDTLGKPYSAAAWLGVVPDNFTVAPGQKALLHYYLQVPLNARPGGHYAGILYTPTTTIGTGSTGPAVQTQIGTLFSIDVAGPIHEEAVVTRFSAENGFSEYGPVNILTQIKNLGDLHIKPAGYMTITDMFGRKLATIPLDEHNIFPQAARDYVNVFGQHWMIGPFTARFAANYGRNDDLTLSATATFWVFPWKVAVIIVLIIIAAVLGWMVWKKRQEPKEPMHEEKEVTKAEEAPQATTEK